jgi:hypothetical protein
MAAADQEPSTGRQRRGLAIAQQRALLRVAAHDQARAAELAHPLEHRLERGPLRPADAAGQHQVQADVATLREQVGERRERVAGLR